MPLTTDVLTGVPGRSDPAASRTLSRGRIPGRFASRSVAALIFYQLRRECSPTPTDCTARRRTESRTTDRKRRRGRSRKEVADLAIRGLDPPAAAERRRVRSGRLILHVEVRDEPDVVVLARSVWHSEHGDINRRCRWPLSLHLVAIDDHLSADAETVFHSRTRPCTHDVVDF